MQRITAFLINFLSIIIVCAQITTTKIAAPKQTPTNDIYDSLKNFLGEDVNKYVGQDLYLQERRESEQKYFYKGFCIDYKKDVYASNNSNIYKKNPDGLHSQYSEMAGKYFKVLEIINYKLSIFDKVFLKLQEKTSGDIVYFDYDSKYDFNFPFVVVGYFEKAKKIAIGQEYVFPDGRFYKPRDITTGNLLTIKTGQKWKCIDVTIAEVNEIDYCPSLIITNELGQKTLMPCRYILEDKNGNSYTGAEADRFRKKFGQYFDVVLQGKVKIGMTKEMCKLSWGEPKSINETITAGHKSEQWVYDSNYLYFVNNVLTTMQQ